MLDDESPHNNLITQHIFICNHKPPRIKPLQVRNHLCDSYVVNCYRAITNNNDEFRVPSSAIKLVNSQKNLSADTRAIQNQLSLDLEICP